MSIIKGAAIAQPWHDRSLEEDRASTLGHALDRLLAISSEWITIARAVAELGDDGLPDAGKMIRRARRFLELAAERIPSGR